MEATLSNVATNICGYINIMYHSDCNVNFLVLLKPTSVDVATISCHQAGLIREGLVYNVI